MENKQKNSSSQEIGEQVLGAAQDILHKGNIRHLVIKSESGSTILDTSLTVAAIGAVAAFVFLPFWPIAIALIIVGIITKVQIEIVRELGEDDSVVMSHLSDDDKTTTFEPDTSRISAEEQESSN